MASHSSAEKLSPLMRQTGFRGDPGNLLWLAQALGAPCPEVQVAVLSLQSRGLLRFGRRGRLAGEREIAVAAAAARRARTSLEAAVIDYLLQTTSDPKHPHIARTPGVCGGEPVIRGTGIAADGVADYFFAGKGIPDVQRDYPQLTAEEILDALHFVLDRRREAAASAA